MANWTALAYLVSAVLFILALKGLSSPTSARRGNVYGMIGMAIAIVATLAAAHKPNLGMIGGGIVIGGIIGATLARRVQMTDMPQLVAAMHSLVGLVAVLIAVAAIASTPHHGAARQTIHQGVHRCHHLHCLGRRVRQAVRPRRFQAALFSAQRGWLSPSPC
jgi:NAD/NADP transhydrogenase beta subunit